MELTYPALLSTVTIAGPATSEQGTSGSLLTFEYAPNDMLSWRPQGKSGKFYAAVYNFTEH